MYFIGDSFQSRERKRLVNVVILDDIKKAVNEEKRRLK